MVNSRYTDLQVWKNRYPEKKLLKKLVRDTSTWILFFENKRLLVTIFFKIYTSTQNRSLKIGHSKINWVYRTLKLNLKIYTYKILLRFFSRKTHAPLCYNFTKKYGIWVKRQKQYENLVVCACWDSRRGQLSFLCLCYHPTPQYLWSQLKTFRFHNLMLKSPIPRSCEFF